MKTSSKHKYMYKSHYSAATHSNSIMTGVYTDVALYNQVSLVGKQPWVQDCSCMLGGRSEPGSLLCNTSWFQWVFSWTYMRGCLVPAWNVLPMLWLNSWLWKWRSIWCQVGSRKLSRQQCCLFKYFHFNFLFLSTVFTLCLDKLPVGIWLLTLTF